MRNWDILDETGVCRANEDYKDAQIVCNELNIPLHEVNFVKEYWNNVFCNLMKEYQTGYTPNPDILCNKYIKFDLFYKYAVNKLGADAIATGHYARTSFGDYLEHFMAGESERLIYNADQMIVHVNVFLDVRLLVANDETKDQTFFLCQVQQEALRRTMFPLGSIKKADVKRIAMDNNFEKLALKRESMGICFIGPRNFQDFIAEVTINTS